MTKNAKIYLILGIGVAGLAWWWYRRSQGLSLIPNIGGSGGAGFAGSGSTLPTTGGGGTAVDNATIVQARSAQTGALSRSQCLFPNRWINTTSGPYYGKCVQGDVFAQWIALPNAVQAYATDATYAQFMTAIGR